MRVRLRGLEEEELGWGMKSLGVVGGKGVSDGYALDRRAQGATEKLRGLDGDLR